MNTQTNTVDAQPNTVDAQTNAQPNTVDAQTNAQPNTVDAQTNAQTNTIDAQPNAQYKKVNFIKRYNYYSHITWFLDENNKVDIDEDNKFQDCDNGTTGVEKTDLQKTIDWCMSNMISKMYTKPTHVPVFVRKVKNVDDKFPDINEEMLNKIKMKKMSMQDIKEYFATFNEPNHRFIAVKINNVQIGIVNEMAYAVCAGCSNAVSGAFKCNVCNNFICKNCFSLKRDELKNCFEHEKQKNYSLVAINANLIYCDVCNEIPFDLDVQSNRIDNIDICSKCFNSNRANELLEKYKNIDGYKLWKKHKFTYHVPVIDGNLFSFIPVLKGDCGLMIMYNIDRDSKYYHKWMIRVNPFVSDKAFLYYQADDTFEDIFEKIQKYVNDLHAVSEQKNNEDQAQSERIESNKVESDNSSRHMSENLNE